MTHAIEVNQLTKKYHSTNNNGNTPNGHQARREHAVDKLTFNIEKGMLYGLVGPDGAGKTTTLRILATVMPQTSGSVSVLGWDTRKDNEKIRVHAGYMPQNFSLYPDLTVMENLNFFANINGVKRDKKNERIKEMLAFTRLAEFSNRRGGNLSGGMKKKLALACALIHNPDVLLLDEPSTGVDPVSRRELWTMLARVINQGVTILVTTPYMDEAERCHQVGVLYDGKLLTSDTPEKLKAMLPFSIVEVKAKPRKVARQSVDELDGVLAWRPVGDRIRLSVGNSQRAQKALNASLKKKKADVRLLRQSKVNMEDVFIHLADHEAS